MFTGIIESLGTVTQIETLPQGRILHLEESQKHSFTLGESIAVNGVCLTVSGPGPTFFISPETLAKTNLSALQTGHKVNLERALTLATRLSGHLVQGHVDGQATLVSLEHYSIDPQAPCIELRVSIPSELTRYTVEKGSLTLNGISLTINKIHENHLWFMIIPHTWQHTNLHSLKPGARLNIEVDVIAKYVEKLCTPYLKP